MEMEIKYHQITERQKDLIRGYVSVEYNNKLYSVDFMYPLGANVFVGSINRNQRKSVLSWDKKSEMSDLVEQYLMDNL